MPPQAAGSRERSGDLVEARRAGGLDEHHIARGEMAASHSTAVLLSARRVRDYQGPGPVKKHDLHWGHEKYMDGLKRNLGETIVCYQRTAE